MIGCRDFQDACVSWREFHPWTFVLLRNVGDGTRVASVHHLKKEDGVEVLWSDDPDRLTELRPLLESMGPLSLGTYEAILESPGCMEIFAAVCRATQDLPEPLLAVQVIHWVMSRRALSLDAGADLAVAFALYSLAKAQSASCHWPGEPRVKAAGLSGRVARVRR